MPNKRVRVPYQIPLPMELVATIVRFYCSLPPSLVLIIPSTWFYLITTITTITITITVITTIIPTQSPSHTITTPITTFTSTPTTPSMLSASAAVCAWLGVGTTPAHSPPWAWVPATTSNLLETSPSASAQGDLNYICMYICVCISILCV